MKKFSVTGYKCCGSQQQQEFQYSIPTQELDSRVQDITVENGLTSIEQEILRGVVLLGINNQK